MRTTARAFSRKRPRRPVKSSPLSFPPASRTTGVCMAMSAFLQRIDVGRLGIVEVNDAVDLGDFFAPVRQGLVIAECLDSDFARDLVKIGHGQGREHVFGIVRADEMSAALLQDLFAMRDQPAVDQLVIGGEALRAESDPARHQARETEFRVEHRVIVDRLVAENLALGEGVFLHRRVTIEMIRRQVEVHAHARTEIDDVLELERADLEHHDIEIGALAHRR